jgi:hypothetical protein
MSRRDGDCTRLRQDCRDSGLEVGMGNLPNREAREPDTMEVLQFADLLDLCQSEEHVV